MRVTTIQRLLIVFAFGACFVEIILAQRFRPESPFLVHVDFARFRHTDTTACLDVFLSVYPRLVTVEADSGGLRGGVLLDIDIFRADDSLQVKRARLFIPVQGSDTSDPRMDQTLSTTMRYGIGFGRYHFAMRATDSLDHSRVLQSTRSFTVAPIGDSIAISDVQLCLSIKPQQKEGSVFNKNTLEVVPNPSLVFGESICPVLAYYTEVYNLDPAAAYRVRAEVFDASGKLIRQSSKTKVMQVVDAVDVGSMVVSMLPSAKYRLKLTIGDTLGRDFASAERSFFALNPQIKQTALRPETAKSAEMMGMTADELAEEFLGVQYLALDKDIKLFNNISSADARREYLATFWGEIESGQRGIRDMTRALYLSRIKTANERFRAMGKLGWRADRGRVFILNGEPDEIQRFPSSEGNKPYEIWNYYQLENGVIFAFVDRTGFGDYVLVHSTKRGELQDEGWERYLR